jgi:hypothetical protein
MIWKKFPRINVRDLEQIAAFDIGPNILRQQVKRRYEIETSGAGLRCHIGELTFRGQLDYVDLMVDIPVKGTAMKSCLQGVRHNAAKPAHDVFLVLYPLG